MSIRKKSKVFWVFIVIFTLLVIYLEFINPYYFLRNDNLFQFFGPMINAFEGLLSGSFPWLNHFQNMGVPLFEMGYYPVLYPPLFFSYLISMLFNNPYLLFEIFTVFHLFLAFIFTYFLARKLSKNEIISGIATLSYVFSGYIMIKLHDWYYVAPAIMFMPLLLLIHEKKSNKIKSFLFLGFIRGVFFYSGNIQFVTYSLFFEFI